MTRIQIIRSITAAVIVLATVTTVLVWKSMAPEFSSQKDAPWSHYLHGHTSGLVSKREKISVRFINDVTSAERAGKEIDGVLRFQPAIAGTAVFNNPRELVFVPAAPLKPGQNYKASLNTGKLSGFPWGMSKYDFSFQVIKPEFEINIFGLSPASKPGRFELKGTLITSDVEDADAIRQVLHARHLDKPKIVTWTHHTGGKHHSFVIGDIERKKEKSRLELTWDGKTFGAQSTGGRSIDIPEIGAFNVVQVRGVQDNKQYILIQFSDHISARQNLNGLIKLQNHPFTTRVEGNSIKLYPQDTLKGEVTVSVEQGIQSALGDRMKKAFEAKVGFTSLKPQVRFAGKGVILPENDVLSIPFEAVNVNSVQVTAFLVYEKNMGQFLQNNGLDQHQELSRVGRYLWRKTIALSAAQSDQWNRFALDATPLLRKHPGALYRLTLSINRGNSTYTCPEKANQVPVTREAPFQNHDDLNVVESSGWDFADQEYNNENTQWKYRNDPCKDAYYTHAKNVSVSRNFFASNIGMIAKKDAHGEYHIITTDIRDGSPLAGVKIRMMNFQNQPIGEVASNNDGFAVLKPRQTPFYLAAVHANQKGYLKVNAGTALATSHFDVGGQKLEQGMKGFIYGERGVWRPGDDIYLTFVLEDKSGKIPPRHPATIRLLDPQGKTTTTITNNRPLGGFYVFKLHTEEKAPTGNWLAKVFLGGAVFSKTLKIETVVPNRLKVELDVGEQLHASQMPLSATLFSQWLHGASAAGLKADVSVNFSTTSTKFDRFTDYSFDDPAREFSSERQTIFEGTLDEQGYARFEKNIKVAASPGMLRAHFLSRVFEKGGDFSSGQKQTVYFPYENYIGLKLPKGDRTRGMLLTDTDHTVQLGSLNSKGKPVSLSRVQVTMYKIDWKWWWDRTQDSLARYASASHSSKIKQDTVMTVNGKGTWTFRIKYPDWGRYLIRACDLAGKHCSGKVLYVDWPGWAGRAQDDNGGPGASVLNFTADRESYQPGDKAVLQLPDSSEGRALLTVENGSRILQQQWVMLQKGKTKVEIAITPAMAPNVYASISLIQPHRGKNNDRPIRLYGTIPLQVQDPATLLAPQLTTSDEWEPESQVTVKVAEKNAKPMTYTLAIVDEGLLGLTGFRTPDLHGHFYRKEALGIQTWDMFDLVVGAYGGALEKLLAIGGDEEGIADDGARKKKRFPPVVKFLGPFQLKAGDTAEHRVKLPNYVGAVRAMVVAGNHGAYGLADKTIPVKKALMILPTLPRVVGPDETFSIPVTVFTMDESIKNVRLTVSTGKNFEIIGDASVNVTFKQAGEKIAILGVRAKSAATHARITISAAAGGHKAEKTTYLAVRSPNPQTTEHSHHVVAAGEQLKLQVKPHGIPGSNQILLEASAVPPMNLQSRLGYLIRYPHGCVEQVTSAAFPQLYLPRLLELDDKQKKDIDDHIHAAIEKLRRYQNATGGFLYWPGSRYHGWANNYTGHFLVEAEKSGYQVPVEMMSDWLNFQKQAAQSWSTGGDVSTLEQAYRLYTLALAGKAELGAMNRMRESGARMIPLTNWYLAASYQLVGQPQAAQELMAGLPLDINDYPWRRDTFGSKLRDQAIVLQALTLMSANKELAEKATRVAQAISDQLVSDRVFNTQALAFALSAMAQYSGGDGKDHGFAFSYSRNGKNLQSRTGKPLYTTELKAFALDGENLVLNNNAGKKLFFTVVKTGVPKAGDENDAQQGLRLDVRYTDNDGNELDVTRLPQGRDLVARLTIANNSGRTLNNLALTHMVASGWQIHNARFHGDGKNRGANNQHAGRLQYQDIRDDRIYTYFGLKPGDQLQLKVALNSSYAGKYYLPAIAVEDMYNDKIHARVKGRWIEVAR